MKVFLAGIIQGSIAEAKIHDQDWRGPIKDAIARHLSGAEIYCHYAEHPNSIAYDMPDIRRTLREGIARAGSCDLLVAYVPSASMGTAIEMYEAHRHGAAVLTISPMQANWIIRAYSDEIFPDVQAFEAYLAAGRCQALMDRKRRGAGPGA